MWRERGDQSVRRPKAHGPSNAFLIVYLLGSVGGWAGGEWALGRCVNAWTGGRVGVGGGPVVLLGMDGSVRGGRVDCFPRERFVFCG